MSTQEKTSRSSNPSRSSTKPPPVLSGGIISDVSTTFTELSTLLQFTYGLIVVVITLACVLTLSAILLDWAKFFRGEYSNPHLTTSQTQEIYRQNQHHQGKEKEYIYIVKASDSIQIQILKAIVSGVIGMLVVNMVKLYL
eukprot:Pgem_evm1s3035